jgi:lysozyme family protein
MNSFVDIAIDALLKREGGYVNDPNDAGGETNFGITVAVARANGYRGPMRDLTRDQASLIYKTMYWERPGYDLIAKISQSVAEELFDTGVNMGTSVATTFLQRSLNVLNRNQKDWADLNIDGSAGQMTRNALSSLISRRGKEGELVLLKALNCLQGARYIELAERRSANQNFIFGWLAHRVNL